MTGISERRTRNIGCPGHGWGALFAALLARPGRRPAVLDPRTLPDHLKRDMGFLDGNDPSGRRP